MEVARYKGGPAARTKTTRTPFPCSRTRRMTRSLARRRTRRQRSVWKTPSRPLPPRASRRPPARPAARRAETHQERVPVVRRGARRGLYPEGSAEGACKPGSRHDRWGTSRRTSGKTAHVIDSGALRARTSSASRGSTRRPGGSTRPRPACTRKLGTGGKAEVGIGHPKTKAASETRAASRVRMWRNLRREPSGRKTKQTRQSSKCVPEYALSIASRFGVRGSRGADARAPGRYGVRGSRHERDRAFADFSGVRARGDAPETRRPGGSDGQVQLQAENAHDYFADCTGSIAFGKLLQQTRDTALHI